jgi:hypothetical protein
VTEIIKILRKEDVSMRYKIITIGFILCAVIFLNSVFIQADTKDSWNKIVYVQLGFFGNGFASSIEEQQNQIQYFDTFVTVTDVKYKIGPIFTGGFELSKKYIGFQGNIGASPANIGARLHISLESSQFTEEVEFNVTTVYGEGAFLFFPLGSGIKKLSPYATIGIGGFILSEDAHESGYFISYGGGLRIFFKEKYGINFGFKGFYMEPLEIENITFELKPIQVTVGFMYRF